MQYLKQKPFSVNDAWQGQRFRTKLYVAFAERVTRILQLIRPPKPDADAPLFAHYMWGLSNVLSDVDNPAKPFQDVLFDAWKMKEKDHRVRFMILEKIKTKKGQEFIGFHVDTDDTLIEYLEKLLARLKLEKEKADE